MDVKFPRPADKLPRAWGLEGAKPTRIWERLSPSYEAQAERLMRALEDLGLEPQIAGAGSEDGEFIAAHHPDGGTTVFFYHLEEPASAKELAAVADSELEQWITDQVSCPLPAKPASHGARQRHTKR